MIPGAVINMGGVDYIVPPLNFAALMRLEPELTMMVGIGSGIPSVEVQRAVVEIVRTALSRNYPEVTTETVAAGLDMGNMQSVIMAIMGQSGLIGGKAKPGEAQSQ